jgi:S-adenosylmethionine synthetase
MRDFRDAKVMARALRDALKAKAIETTHAEALELIAKAFGYKSWNILSAKIEAVEPKPGDERSLSASSPAAPPKRSTRTRDRHGKRADPSQITRDYIACLARLAVKDIGHEQRGFHWEQASIDVYLHAQSADITQGVDSAGNKDEGAGDQGIMFGYACRETPELMPAPIYYAHRILKVMSTARRSGETHALGTDAKSQVTIRYEAGKPVEAPQIVVSTQHVDEKLSSHDIQALVEPYVRQAMPQGWISKQTVWHVNPTGKFVIGGPDGDCGPTERKIIVDT